MGDWRYENLSDDMKRLREELYEIRGRTHKIETWQSLLPFRIWLAICWLVIIGMWVFNLAEPWGR